MQTERHLTRLAIVTTHPIQYNAPLFKLLTLQEGLVVKVFYTWGKSVLDNKFDPGFGKSVTWDIPLLDGYDYEFLENIASEPGSSHYNGINNPGIVKRILDYQPTALLIFGWNFKSHLKCLRYFKNKIPIFFRGDSTLLNEKPGLRKIGRRMLLRWVYGHIDYALYVGKNNKQYFLEHGLTEDQLVFAPHAIDINRFMEPADEYCRDANDWKKSLGIQKHEITVLYAGKLESVKNPFYLLQLADDLKGWPVKLIIVGNGPLEADIKRKANGNSQVVFIDFQNQSLMPVVYRLGDIFIMCSVSETWGLGANEAMASGCVPVLSEKVGAASDLVNPQSGFVFPLSDTATCASFIKKMAADKIRLAEMKETSLKLIQQFSFNSIVGALLAKLKYISKD